MFRPCLSSFCESARQPMSTRRSRTDQRPRAAAVGLWSTQNVGLGEHGAQPVQGRLPCPWPVWRLSWGSLLSCRAGLAQPRCHTGSSAAGGSSTGAADTWLRWVPSCRTQDTGSKHICVFLLAVYTDLKTARAPGQPSRLSSQLDCGSGHNPRVVRFAPRWAPLSVASD